MTASTSAASRFLPFDASDPVWSDIQPTYQQESSNPLCPIMYKPEYSAAMDLFRSLVSGSTLSSSSSSSSSNSSGSKHLEARTGKTPDLELSPRALALTEHLVRINPSHYSIWQYRAKILLEGTPHASEPPSQPGSSSPAPGGSNDHHDDETRQQALRDELDFLDLLAHENMKSYQVWQHRRLIVSALGDPSRELAFIATNLARDSKNYHTWAYRQWVLAHFGGLDSEDGPSSRQRQRQQQPPPRSNGGESAAEAPAGPGAGAFPHLWDGELDYTEKLLVEDVRNNSAWNHRWFCIFARRAARPKDGMVAEAWEEGMQKVVRAEIGFTKAQIALAPNNASAWNYLRGIHLASPIPTDLSDSLSFAQSLISTPLEAERDPSVDQFGRSPVQAIEWCLDCVEEALQKGKKGEEERRKALEEAEKLVARLCRADPIRKRFWGYRLQTVRRKAA